LYAENLAVLILQGGDKSTQEKDIQKAKVLLKKYKESFNENEKF
jgi:putative component of toxin-antitoxin plasmid stabilization module